MLLFIFSTTAYAQKQEYIDKNLDLTQDARSFRRFDLELIK